MAVAARGPFRTVSAESDNFDDEKTLGEAWQSRAAVRPSRSGPPCFFTATVIAASPASAADEPADGIHFLNQTNRTRTVTIGDVFDKIDGIDKDKPRPL